MANVIVVTEEELQELLLPPHKDKWYRDIEEARWKERLEEAKEPILIGYTEDGMALYQLHFTMDHY